MNIFRCAPICGLALISSIFSSRADWSIADVDAGSGIGHAASLAIDTAGFPHISYYRPHAMVATESNLFYATRTGSSWSTEPIVNGITNGTQGSATSIVVTDLGNPAVSFTRGNTLVKYTIRSAGSWTSSIDVGNFGGGFSSMVWQGTEAAPTPQVAYNDSSNAVLKVAILDTGTFFSSTLDTSITAGSCSLAQVGAYMGVAYIDGVKLGFWDSLNSGMTWGEYSPNIEAQGPFKDIKASVCALALAQTKKNNTDPTRISAHIFYFDNADNRYKYVTNDTTSGLWAAPELVYQSSTAIAQSGCSIVVDDAGTVYVAFLDYGTKRLGYAKRTPAGVWSAAEFIEGSNLGGAFCTIRLNDQELPCIAYAGLAFDNGSYEVSGLRFAEFSSTSGPLPPGSVSDALSFAITGKSKRTAKRSSLTIKGTASASAVSIEWRIGKKKNFKKKAISGGAWSVKIKQLMVGKNKVEFRAASSAGTKTAIKKLKITRKL